MALDNKGLVKLEVKSLTMSWLVAQVIKVKFKIIDYRFIGLKLVVV